MRIEQMSFDQVVPRIHLLEKIYGSYPEAPPDKTPIDSLPDELLCEIFGLLQSDDRFLRKWCRVLWVCRRWSAVGRAAAFLWCNIIIRWMPNRSLIVANLKYSKNALLTIDFRGSDQFAETLPLLSPHIHRIRSFKIYDPLESATDSSLATFLSYPFPSLEIFEDCSQPAQNPLIWQPDASDYPRLRNLVLEGSVSIKVAPTTVFSALTTLILKESSNPSFTLQSFIQFLTLHPHIEELKLDRYNLAVDSPFAARMFPRTIRRFALSGYGPNFVKHFLSSFTHIPGSVSFFISQKYDEHEPEIPPHKGISPIHMLPDPPQRHLHTISRVTSVEIQGNLDDTYILVGCAVLRGTGTFVAFESHTNSWPPPIALPRQLFDVVYIFNGAPVTEVILADKIVGDFPKGEWVTLFDAFPLLEHIYVGHYIDRHLGDTRAGLFEALLEPTPGGGPRWPSLRRFTLAYGNCATFSIGALPQVLQARAEQGTKVDQLCLIFKCGTWTWELNWSEERDKLVSWLRDATWRIFVNDISFQLLVV